MSGKLWVITKKILVLTLVVVLILNDFAGLGKLSSNKNRDSGFISYADEQNIGEESDGTLQEIEFRPHIAMECSNICIYDDPDQYYVHYLYPSEVTLSLVNYEASIGATKIFYTFMPISQEPLPSEGNLKEAGWNEYEGSMYLDQYVNDSEESMILRTIAAGEDDIAIKEGEDIQEFSFIFYQMGRCMINGDNNLGTGSGVSGDIDITVYEIPQESEVTIEYRTGVNGDISFEGESEIIIGSQGTVKVSDILEKAGIPLDQPPEYVTIYVKYTVTSPEGDIVTNELQSDIMIVWEAPTINATPVTDENGNIKGYSVSILGYEGEEIRYSIDHTVPEFGKIYTEPFFISNTAYVRAVVMKQGEASVMEELLLAVDAPFMPNVEKGESISAVVGEDIVNHFDFTIHKKSNFQLNVRYGEETDNVLVEFSLYCYNGEEYVPVENGNWNYKSGSYSISGNLEGLPLGSYRLVMKSISGKGILSISCKVVSLFAVGITLSSSPYATELPEKYISDYNYSIYIKAYNPETIVYYSYTTDGSQPVLSLEKYTGMTISGQEYTELIRIDDMNPLVKIAYGAYDPDLDEIVEIKYGTYGYLYELSITAKDGSGRPQFVSNSSYTGFFSALYDKTGYIELYSNLINEFKDSFESFDIYWTASSLPNRFPLDAGGNISEDAIKYDPENKITAADVLDAADRTYGQEGYVYIYAVIKAKTIDGRELTSPNGINYAMVYIMPAKPVISIHDGLLSILNDSPDHARILYTTDMSVTYNELERMKPYTSMLSFDMNTVVKAVNVWNNVSQAYSQPLYSGISACDQPFFLYTDNDLVKWIPAINSNDNYSDDYFFPVRKGLNGEDNIQRFTVSVPSGYKYVLYNMMYLSEYSQCGGELYVEKYDQGTDSWAKYDNGEVFAKIGSGYLSSLYAPYLPYGEWRLTFVPERGAEPGEVSLITFSLNKQENPGNYTYPPVEGLVVRSDTSGKGINVDASGIYFTDESLSEMLDYVFRNKEGYDIPSYYILKNYISNKANIESITILRRNTKYNSYSAVATLLADQAQTHQWQYFDDSENLSIGDHYSYAIRINYKECKHDGINYIIKNSDWFRSDYSASAHPVYIDTTAPLISDYELSGIYTGELNEYGYFDPTSQMSISFKDDYLIENIRLEYAVYDEDEPEYKEFFCQEDIGKENHTVNINLNDLYRELYEQNIIRIKIKAIVTDFAGISSEKEWEEYLTLASMPKIEDPSVEWEESKVLVYFTYRQGMEYVVTVFDDNGELVAEQNIITDIPDGIGIDFEAPVLGYTVVIEGWVKGDPERWINPVTIENCNPGESKIIPQIIEISGPDSIYVYQDTKIEFKYDHLPTGWEIKIIAQWENGDKADISSIITGDSVIIDMKDMSINPEDQNGKVITFKLTVLDLSGKGSTEVYRYIYADYQNDTRLKLSILNDKVKYTEGLIYLDYIVECSQSTFNMVFSITDKDGYEVSGDEIKLYNNYIPGYVYDWQKDISGLEEGEYKLTVSVFTSQDSKREEITIEFVVDKSAPEKPNADMSGLSVENGILTGRLDFGDHDDREEKLYFYVDGYDTLEQARKAIEEDLCFGNFFGGIAEEDIDLVLNDKYSYYVISVRSVDHAGNKSRGIYRIITLPKDVSYPSNVSAIPLNGRNIVKWQGSDGAEYYIYRNGLLIAKVEGEYFTDIDITEGEKYTYGVSLQEDMNIIYAEEVVASKDDIIPYISNVYPSSGAVLSTEQRFNIICMDNSRIDHIKVEWYGEKENINKRKFIGEYPYSADGYSIDLSVINGESNKFNLVFTAVDLRGNESVIKIVPYILDGFTVNDEEPEGERTGYLVLEGFVMENRKPNAGEENLFTIYLSNPQENYTGRVSVYISSYGDSESQLIYSEYLSGVTESQFRLQGLFKVPEKQNMTVTVEFDSKDGKDVYSPGKYNINQRPVPKIDILHSDMGFMTGGKILFSAGETHDPEGDEIEYIWDMGDGTILKGAEVTHIYTAPGKYSIKLKATDQHSATGITYYDIEIIDGRADISIGDMDYVVEDNKIQIKTTIRNELYSSLADISKDCPIEVLLYVNGKVKGGEYINRGLPVGGTAEIVFEYIPEPGIQKITLTASFVNGFIDRDTSDNTKNLIIDSPHYIRGNISLGQASVNEGMVEVVVANNGTVQADTYVSFYTKGNLREQKKISLAPGEEITVSFDAPKENGLIYCSVIAGDTSFIDEDRIDNEISLYIKNEPVNIDLSEAELKVEDGVIKVHLPGLSRLPQMCKMEFFVDGVLVATDPENFMLYHEFTKGIHQVMVIIDRDRMVLDVPYKMLTEVIIQDPVTEEDSADKVLVSDKTFIKVSLEADSTISIPVDIINQGEENISGIKGIIYTDNEEVLAYLTEDEISDIAPGEAKEFILNLEADSCKEHSVNSFDLVICDNDNIYIQIKIIVSIIPEESSFGITEGPEYIFVNPGVSYRFLYSVSGVDPENTEVRAEFENVGNVRAEIVTKDSIALIITPEKREVQGVYKGYIYIEKEEEMMSIPVSLIVADMSEGTLKVNVKDIFGNPVENAQVIIQGLWQGYTDHKGRVYINSSEGEYFCSVTAPGYNTFGTVIYLMPGGVTETNAVLDIKDSKDTGEQDIKVNITTDGNHIFTNENNTVILEIINNSSEIMEHIQTGIKFYCGPSVDELTDITSAVETFSLNGQSGVIPGEIIPGSSNCIMWSYVALTELFRMAPELEFYISGYGEYYINGQYLYSESEYIRLIPAIPAKIEAEFIIPAGIINSPQLKVLVSIKNSGGIDAENVILDLSGWHITEADFGLGADCKKEGSALIELGNIAPGETISGYIMLYGLEEEDIYYIRDFAPRFNHTYDQSIHYSLEGLQDEYIVDGQGVPLEGKVVNGQIVSQNDGGFIFELKEKGSFAKIILKDYDKQNIKAVYYLDEETGAVEYHDFGVYYLDNTLLCISGELKSGRYAVVYGAEVYIEEFLPSYILLTESGREKVFYDTGKYHDEADDIPLSFKIRLSNRGMYREEGTLYLFVSSDGEDFKLMDQMDFGKISAGSEETIYMNLSPEAEALKAGSYKFKIGTSIDPDRSDIITDWIIINSVPVAKITPQNPQTVAIGEYFTLSGRNSFDKDRRIILYIWDMGDGNVYEGIDVVHRYLTPGEYKVTLTVLDSNNTQSVCYVDINAFYNENDINITLNADKTENLSFGDVVNITVNIIAGSSMPTGVLTDIILYVDNKEYRRETLVLYPDAETKFNFVYIAEDDMSHVISVNNCSTLLLQGKNDPGFCDVAVDISNIKKTETDGIWSVDVDVINKTGVEAGDVLLTFVVDSKIIEKVNIGSIKAFETAKSTFNIMLNKGYHEFKADVSTGNIDVDTSNNHKTLISPLVEDDNFSFNDIKDYYYRLLIANGYISGGIWNGIYDIDEGKDFYNILDIATQFIPVMQRGILVYESLLYEHGEAVQGLMGKDAYIAADRLSPEINEAYFVAAVYSMYSDLVRMIGEKIDDEMVKYPELNEYLGLFKEVYNGSILSSERNLEEIYITITDLRLKYIQLIEQLIDRDPFDYEDIEGECASSAVSLLNYGIDGSNGKVYASFGNKGDSIVNILPVLTVKYGESQVYRCTFRIPSITLAPGQTIDVEATVPVSHSVTLDYKVVEVGSGMTMENKSEYVAYFDWEDTDAPEAVPGAPQAPQILGISEDFVVEGVIEGDYNVILLIEDINGNIISEYYNIEVDNTGMFSVKIKAPELDVFYIRSVSVDEYGNISQSEKYQAEGIQYDHLKYGLPFCDIFVGSYGENGGLVLGITSLVVIGGEIAGNVYYMKTRAPETLFGEGYIFYPEEWEKANVDKNGYYSFSVDSNTSSGGLGEYYLAVVQVLEDGRILKYGVSDEAFLFGEVEVLYGDVDEDGIVSMKDATLLLRFLAEWEDLEINIINGDMDGSGSVNSKDATLLLRLLTEAY